MTHFERMIPLLQVAIHTNIFHTEHEDYAFWQTAMTSMLESHMERPAVAVPQSKVWLMPKAVQNQLEDMGKKAIASGSDRATTPSSSTYGEAASMLPSDLSERAQYTQGGDAHIINIPSTQSSQAVEANLQQVAQPVLTVDSAISEDIVPEGGPVATLDNGVTAHDEVSTRGDDDEEGMFDSDEESIGDMIDSKLDENHQATYLGIEGARPHAHAGSTTPLLRTRSSTGEGTPQNGKFPSIPRGSATHDFNFRTRPPPRPRSASPASASDQVSNGEDVKTEFVDWMDEAIDKAGFDEKSPSDEPCNMKAAFLQFTSSAEFYIPILCENKQTPSRRLVPQPFNAKSRVRVRAGMRSLMVQVAYLLTSEAWVHQDRVIGMVTLGDQFCWNEFERIQDRKPMENWKDYTFETRPFNTCRAWSNLVQWGTPAAEEAIQIMMARVNAIFPATVPQAPPPASESSQDDSPSSLDFTLADLSTPSSRAASGEQAQNGVDPNLPVDEFWDEPYDPDADELQEDAQASASDPESSEIDVPDINMGDAPTLSSAVEPPAAPASAVTPTLRLRWRKLERQDTQDTDLDAGGTVDGDVDDPDDGDLSGRTLQGEATLATFEAFASVSLRNTHETAPPPANADNDSGDDNDKTSVNTLHVDLGDANDNFASVDAIDGGGRGDSVGLADGANDGDGAIANSSANVHLGNLDNGPSAPANTGGGEGNVHAAPAHGGDGASNVMTVPALGGGGNAPANPTVNPDNSRKRYASPDPNSDKQMTKKVRLMSPDVGDPSASQAGPSGTQPKRPSPARKKGKQVAGPARDSKG
ncbi:hypothetical protein HDZ31DRAFT_63087 [Schizophyllum fasciatum]